MYHQGNIFLKYDTDMTGDKRDDSGGGCKDCQIDLHGEKILSYEMIILLFCSHQ